MDGGGNGRLRFGDFEFNSQSGKLLREDRPVKIQPQPLRVLSVLLESAGEIVSREQLRTRVWGDATFVEFDQGLNYCIRQIRLALRDAASEPLYIETLPKQGYRFIARVTAAPGVPEADGANQAAAEAGPNQIVTEASADSPQPAAPDPVFHTLALPPRKLPAWRVALGAFAVLAIGGVAVYSSLRAHPAEVKYTQLTDFTDSALAPALSPDGRMVAFIRGSSSFLTADQVYVKVLPNGEARRLTDDSRLKYNLAFTPDGAQIAYTVLQVPNWSTYIVSVLGGDSHLFLGNAAGLTWLDRRQLLFSRTRTGQHMGIVTGTAAGQDFREIYFPPHERAMAHYSWASPDRKSALVVEMDENSGWAPCRLISLDGRFDARPIGPQGPCRSAGWSPDGSWMYFTASVDGKSHLWRQRFADGEPELITPGPLEAEGLAVDPDGRSLITSMGVHESAIWIHDANGERSLSSEGEIVAEISPPSFAADDSVLYYLLRRGSDGAGPELWRVTVESGKSEAVFPGVYMLSYDVSPDGKQVVYSAAMRDGTSQLWLAPVDRSSPARRIAGSGETRPHFGPRGQILFQAVEGNFNYLEQVNPDGSGRSKVVPYPIGTILGISPGRRWVTAIVPVPEGGPRIAPMVIPVDGGPARFICANYCSPKWSSTGEFLLIPVEASSRTSPGRSLAIPVGPGETLPELPREGIEPLAKTSVVPGAQSIPRGELIPGKDLAHFAYVNTTVHRNLYRISLPRNSPPFAEVLAGAATWFYNRFRGNPAGVQIQSLAVLPLENLSGDPAQDYFADGITDELITSLAKINSVKVISRTSVAQYKGVHNKPLPQIARELGADAVVEGTLARAGGRVRVTAQLIEAKTDRHIWADRYERSSRDVLLLENEIARAIAEQLRGKLDPREQIRFSAHPVDPAAHEAYLQGRYLWNRRTPPALQEAVRYFTEAIEKDPRFAQAYAGRADTYTVLGSWGNETIPPEEAAPKARADAERAVQLDGTSAEAHTARAAIRHIYEWDWRGAETEFQRAIELSPSYATARQWYGNYLCDLGRDKECLAETDRAHALDPAYLVAALDVGFRRYGARRYPEAIAPIRKVLEFNPDFIPGLSSLGQVYEANRMYPEAVAELRKAVELSNGAPKDVAALGHAYAVSGQRTEARKTLQKLEQLAKRRYVSDYGRALICAGLGENDRALAWLERAFQERSSWMVKLKVDPRLDPLRGDARFTDLVRRVGLTP